jgi:hypothetical protein
VSTPTDPQTPLPAVNRRHSQLRTGGAWLLVLALTVLTVRTLPLGSLFSDEEAQPAADVILVPTASQPILASSIGVKLITVFGDGNGTSELSLAIWDSPEGNNIEGMSIYVSGDVGSAFDRCESRTDGNRELTTVAVEHGLDGSQLGVDPAELLVSNAVPAGEQDFSRIAAPVKGTSFISCYSDDAILQRSTDSGAVVLSPSVQLESDVACLHDTTLQSSLEIRTNADAHLSHSSLQNPSSTSGTIQFPGETSLTNDASEHCGGFVAGGYAAIDVDNAARLESLKSIVAGLAVAWLLTSLVVAARYTRHHVLTFW